MTQAEVDRITARIDPYSAIRVYANLTEEQKANRAIALFAAQRDGLILAYAPESIRRDPEVTRAAVTNYRHAVVHVLNGAHLIRKIA